MKLRTFGKVGVSLTTSYTIVADRSTTVESSGYNGRRLRPDRDLLLAAQMRRLATDSLCSGF